MKHKYVDVMFYTLAIGLFCIGIGLFFLQNLIQAILFLIIAILCRNQPGLLKLLQKRKEIFDEKDD